MRNIFVVCREFGLEVFREVRVCNERRAGVAVVCDVVVVRW